MLKDKHYIEKLKHIRTYVKARWEGIEGLPVYFTLHDYRHNENVEKAIYKLIPPDKYSQFSEEEKFYLLASAWLHDIGMIPTLFGSDDDPQEVRRTHHIRSRDYVMDQTISGGLNLEGGERRIIGQLCQYHRKSENVMDCQETFGKIRLRLLAAYLRLADAIHIDETRVEESLFRIFLKTGMPWDMRYHWLKSFWVKDVEPDFARLILTVQLWISEKDAKDVNIIKEMIEDEVRVELFQVRDILIRGGISYFLDVKTKYGIGIQPQQRIDLQQVISNFQLERRPSASDVIENITNTILEILRLPNKREAYSMLKEYQQEIIQKVVDNRPCHILAHKVNEFIKNSMEGLTLQLSDSELEDRLTKIETVIGHFKEKRVEKIKALIAFAKTVLSDYGSILLFGYSNLVLKSLEALEDKIKKGTQVYICECRNRDQYNDMNELIYCDGVEYASQVKKIGFEKVYLVPDILIGNLMSRERLISKVIFGANGVDIDTGKIGHTGGHLTIANVASIYNVPVYVIVDSYKFGKMKPDATLERKVNWLTSNREIQSKLKEITLFNPREDIVKANGIHSYVTDYGMFPPSRIPEVIRRNLNITQ